MYQLYYMPGRANLAPHMLLEELGVEHELVLIDPALGAQKSAEYRKLNPAAKVPTLVDGDLVLPESAAICLHLLDRHPEAGFSPPIGDPGRSQLYRWLFFLSNTIQPELMLFHYPEDHATAGDCRSMIRSSAETKLMQMFQIVDSALAQNGPFLLGRQISACDFYLLMLARWTREFERPVRLMPSVGQCLELVCQRPKVVAAFASEGIVPPYC